jgi:hypothetical protein
MSVIKSFNASVIRELESFSLVWAEALETSDLVAIATNEDARVGLTGNKVVAAKAILWQRLYA